MPVPKTYEHTMGFGVGCNDEDQGVYRACTGVMKSFSQLRWNVDSAL